MILTPDRMPQGTSPAQRPSPDAAGNGGESTVAAGDTTGILLCGHGSRARSAVSEFGDLARRLTDAFAGQPVEHGYLEFARPTIGEALDRLRARGASHILAVPGMLFAAAHAKNDIPSVLNTYAASHGVRIDYGRELGLDSRMLRAAGDRVRTALEALDRRIGPAPASDTCLVVVGRGASDPDANANVAKMARLLWEGFGLGWCETAYSGVTFPLVEPCLRQVVRLGFKRVVVFPYFLFSGVLVDRIYGFADRVAADHPEVVIEKAPYLGAHEEVIATFTERVREITAGEAVMNCGLCKYRAQVLGFEAEVGAPQESHHHHVEGKGETAPGSAVDDCTFCDTFCTGACRLLSPPSHGHDHGQGHHHHHHHGHHHHHPTYPHEAHPAGPVSVVRDGRYAYERDPAAITSRSFALIRAEADLSRFGAETALAERVAHAVGDLSILGDLMLSGEVTRATREALADGRPVVVDAMMTHHAIATRAVPHERVLCAIADPETAAMAEREGTTRSAAAIVRLREEIDGAVVAIGNAPTALFALLELMREGVAPAALFAFPVGFVGAAESKRALLACRPAFPFVTLQGRRGGSAMAGAALNAAAGLGGA